jgi:hypothetical protein
VGIYLTPLEDMMRCTNRHPRLERKTPKKRNKSSKKKYDGIHFEMIEHYSFCNLNA